MTTVAPMMIFKEWKGSEEERFKHTDMNRIRHNVKTLGAMVNVSYTPVSVEHRDLFRFDEENTLEQTIKDICSKCGIDAPMETDWNWNRGVTFADFDRIEKWSWEAYRILKGEGDRILWNQNRKYDLFTLYADNWTGTGPYFYTLPTSYGADYDEGLVFVRNNATVEQRDAEYNALITVKSSTSEVILQANGIKPKTDIPIIITRGLPAMKETATLTESGWTGVGPWYQTITFSNEIRDGVVTIDENAMYTQAMDFADAGISVSSVSGHNVTFRSVFNKPSINLPILLIYEQSQGV